MGAMQRKLEEQKSKKKGRRYQDTENLWQGVTWRELSGEIIVETMDVVSSAGGALRFGYTRGGGALSLGVYGDGDEPYTLYGNNAGDMENHLKGLQDVFEAIAAEKAAEAR